MKKMKYFKSILLIFWLLSLALRNRQLIIVSGALFAAISLVKAINQFKSGDKKSGVLNLLSAVIFVGLVFTILKFI